ncbi:hypothetical protein OROGR_013498 [Orobanche gracilis]
MWLLWPPYQKLHHLTSFGCNDRGCEGPDAVTAHPGTVEGKTDHDITAIDGSGGNQGAIDGSGGNQGVINSVRIDCPDTSHGEWLVVDKKKRTSNAKKTINVPLNKPHQQGIPHAANNGKKHGGTPTKATTSNKFFNLFDYNGAELLPDMGLQSRVGVFEMGQTSTAKTDRKKRPRKDPVLQVGRERSGHGSGKLVISEPQIEQNQSQQKPLSRQKQNAGGKSIHELYVAGKIMEGAEQMKGNHFVFSQEREVTRAGDGRNELHSGSATPERGQSVSVVEG